MKTSFLSTLLWGWLGLGILSVFFLGLLIIIKVFFPQITRLKIDENIISMNGLPSSPRDSIDKIEFSLHYDTLKHQARRQIVICAKTELYQLPTETLTSREIDWIAFELSRFLNLPLAKYSSRHIN